MNIRKRFLRMRRDYEKIQNTVTQNLKASDGIYVCLQSHYTKLTFSIFISVNYANAVMEKDGVTFIVDSCIDEEKADSIINMILEEIDKEEWVN